VVLSIISIISIINPNLNPNLANTATLQPMEFRVRNHVMATNRLMRE
jgi:hypothetical protein